MVLEFLAIFMPALVAVGVFDYLNKRSVSRRSILTYFGLFAILINLCAFLVTLFIFDFPEVDLTGKSLARYLILTLILSVILPFVVNLVKSIISIEIKKND